MEDFQHAEYSNEVVEFVIAAKAFCDLVEQAAAEEKVSFLARLQKLLPLVYLKGCSLPEREGDATGINEEVVTEDDYNYLRERVWQLMAGDDDYLEVSDESTRDGEMHVVASISEKVCDIYQDLKNFISAYQHGMLDETREALWHVNANFELYWGRACVSVSRAVHAALYRAIDETGY